MTPQYPSNLAFRPSFQVIYQDLPNVEGSQRYHVRRDSYRPLLSRSKSPKPCPTHPQNTTMLEKSSATKGSINQVSETTAPSKKQETVSSHKRSLFTNHLGKTLIISTRKIPTTNSFITPGLEDTKVRDMRAMNKTLTSRLLKLKEERTVMVRLNRALIAKLAAISAASKIC